MAAATDVLGQRNSEEVGGREFAPERGVEAHFAAFELGEALGCGAVLEKLTRDLGDRLLFFGEREVHFAPALPRLSGRAELVQHQVVPVEGVECLVEDLDGHADFVRRRARSRAGSTPAALLRRVRPARRCSDTPSTASADAAASRSCIRCRGRWTRQCPSRVSCTSGTSGGADAAATDTRCTVGSAACGRAGPFQKNSVSGLSAGASRLSPSAVRLESEDAKPLPPEDFTVLVGVCRQPCDEMARAQRRSSSRRRCPRTPVSPR